jgi:hypothetical protein
VYLYVVLGSRFKIQQFLPPVSCPTGRGRRVEQARLGYFPLLADTGQYFPTANPKLKKERTKWQNSRVPEAAWELERTKTLNDFFLVGNIRAG